MARVLFAVVAALVVAVPIATADDVKTEAATAEAFFQVLIGRPEKAESVMAALIADHSTADAWAARTRVQLRVGNVEGAAASAAEARKAAGTAPPEARAAVAEAHALLGAAHQDAGNAERALADYATAVELAPDNLDYRRMHGLLLGMDGRAEDGIAELKGVVEDSSYAGADAWMNLGRRGAARASMRKIGCGG